MSEASKTPEDIEEAIVECWQKGCALEDITDWELVADSLEALVHSVASRLTEALDRAQRAEIAHYDAWAPMFSRLMMVCHRLETGQPITLAEVQGWGNEHPTIEQDRRKIFEQSSRIAELEHEIDEVDGTCNRLAEEKNKVEQDIQAYRGALGYTVPAKYDGKRSDGSTPVCGLCDAKAKAIVGLECELGRRCWHCKLPIYPGEARKSFNPAPHAASGGTWLYAHDQCPALASSGQGATEQPTK